MYDLHEQEPTWTRCIGGGTGVAIAMLMLLGAVTGCGTVGEGTSEPPTATPAVALGGGLGVSPQPPGAGTGGSPPNGQGTGQATPSQGSQGTGEDGNGAQVVIIASPVDCLTYDPSKLAVVSAGASGWYLSTGTSNLALLDTQSDAQDALAMARNHAKSCYIGRDNDRSNRYLYITRYWLGVSGLPLGPAPTLDCVTYDPAKLIVTNVGAGGFKLSSGSHNLAWFDTASDAERGRLVAGEHAQLCLIGADNNRSDHDRYIVEFWRG